MWGLRAAMPKRSRFAGAQFDTLRWRLIKIATRVVEMKTQIRLHMPTACPDQSILRIVLSRIPRLVTWCEGEPVFCRSRSHAPPPIRSMKPTCASDRRQTAIGRLTSARPVRMHSRRSP